MPHVIVKLLAGRSDAQKTAIAEAITRAVMETASCKEAAVSVGLEDIAPDRWDSDVYAPDITGKPETIFKKPGYEPKLQREVGA